MDFRPSALNSGGHGSGSSVRSSPLANSGELQRDATQSQVVQENLIKTISELQSRGGRASFERQSLAAEWIAERFRKNGLEVRLETYEYDLKVWKNVVATIKGTKKPEEYLVVMAHLDTICVDAMDGSPGADDNGSGVAVLLDVARALRDVPLEKSVLFCIFSNEETGCIGSRRFVRDARKNGLQILAAINFDHLGYNPGGFAWDSFKCQGRLKYAIKAFLTVCRNYWISLFNERHAIQVAGRSANAGLVQTVSSSMSRQPGLQVKSLVKDDCG